MNQLAVTAALLLGVLPACASDDSPDAFDPGQDPCTSEHIFLAGAVSANGASAGTVLVADKVVGAQGILGATSYTFVVNDLLSSSLEPEGIHDVAETPIRYVEGTGDGDCTQPGRCHGVIAMGGAVDVVSLAPFHANFELTDLHETDGASSTPGAAVAGKINGCVYAPR